VLTNVVPEELFPHSDPNAPWPFGLPCVVIAKPGVLLSSAAAASSNFPAVFPNMSIQLDGSKRYRVTDGGAAENRGLVCLLYVLRSTLQARVAQPSNRHPPLPTIHIVAADASAIEDVYSEDRGIGEAMGAGEQFANQLVKELLADIQNLYKKLDNSEEAVSGAAAEKNRNAVAGRVEFHLLQMPTFLRSHGGIGTNWMLPDKVTLREPVEIDSESAQKVTLRKGTVVQLVRELHSVPGAPRQNWQVPEEDRAAVDLVRGWLMRENISKQWPNLVESLRR
jgi:hypothetical protein